MWSESICKQEKIKVTCGVVPFYCGNILRTLMIAFLNVVIPFNSLRLKMICKVCFYFLSVFTTTCHGRSSEARKAVGNSTTVINPLRNFFLFTLAGYDSSLHFVLETSRNLNSQKFQLNLFIQKAYRLTRYKTVQITFCNASTLLNQTAQNYTTIANKNQLNVGKNISVLNSRKYSNFIVVDVYLSLRGARDILRNFKFKIIPNIILLYCDKPSKSDSALAKTFQRLRGVPLTSVFTAVHFNYSHFSILCFTCEKGYEIMDGNIRYSALVSKWDAFHKNLQRGRVEINVLTSESVFNFMDTTSCNIHRINVKTLRTFEDLCLHRIVQNFLNYTFNPFKKLSKRQSKLYGDVDTQMVVDSKHVRQMQDRQFEITGRGMVINPYVFFTILNQPDGQVFAMLRPFDTSCWVAISAVLIGYSAVLFLMPLVSKQLHYMGVLLTMFGTILEQPTDTVNRIFRISGIKPFPLMVAWTLWSTMVLQIGNNYKGTMVSLLATKSTPDEPATLKELLDSQLPLITRDGNNIENEVVCAIRDLYLKDILNSMSKPIPASNVFKRLHDSIKWVDAHLSRFESAVAYMKPFNLQDKNESVDLSKTFAIVETNQEAEFRRHLVNAFSDKWISKVYPLSDILTSRQMTAVKRNFFHKFFIKAFSSVEEAGLFTRWATYAWNVWKAALLNAGRFRVNKEAAQVFNATGKRPKYRVNLPKNLNGFIFSKIDHHSSSDLESEMVMSLTVHQATFFLLLFLQAFCVLVFMYELATRYSDCCHFHHSTEVTVFIN